MFKQNELGRDLISKNSKLKYQNIIFEILDWLKTVVKEDAICPVCKRNLWDANFSRFFNEIAPTFLADLNPKNVRFALKKSSTISHFFPYIRQRNVFDQKKVNSRNCQKIANFGSRQKAQI